MDKKLKSPKGESTSSTIITDSCIKSIEFFDANNLTELKMELPIGLASFKNKTKVGQHNIIKVDHISLPERIAGDIALIEPMYFCIRSYRAEGKYIYLEQTLGIPCLKTYSANPTFIYELEPGCLATIKKLIMSTKHIEKFIQEMIVEANEFYQLHCYSIDLTNQ